MGFMNRFLKGLLSGAGVWLLAQLRHLSLELMKAKFGEWYVSGVRAAREVYLLFAALALCAVLAGAGFILLHVGLFALLPHPLDAIVLMVLGAVYVVAGLVIIGRLCNEKTWLRVTRADRFVKSAPNTDAE